jgi:hypothetical protein
MKSTKYGRRRRSCEGEGAEMTVEGWRGGEELAERIRLVEGAHRPEHELTAGDHRLVLLICGAVPVAMMLLGILL